MTDEAAFKAFSERARAAFGFVNNEITKEAIDAGLLTAPEICVALAMAGINVAALAIVGGHLDFEDWKDELATAVDLKRRAYSARQKRKIQ